MDAADRLAGEGISAEVVSFPCFKPLDRETVFRALERFPVILTVEEHNVIGGFGSAVCEAAAERGGPCRVIRMGLKDTFASVVGDQKYLRAYYGINGEAVAEKAKALIG